MSYGSFDVDKYCREQDAIIDRARKESDRAVANGEVVGLLLSFQSCDGYAYYQVERVDGNDIYLRHIDVYDGYVSVPIEYMGRVVPRRLIDNYFGGN